MKERHALAAALLVWQVAALRVHVDGGLPRNASNASNVSAVNAVNVTYASNASNASNVSAVNAVNVTSEDPLDYLSEGESDLIYDANNYLEDYIFEERGASDFEPVHPEDKFLPDVIWNCTEAAVAMTGQDCEQHNEEVRRMPGNASETHPWQANRTNASSMEDGVGDAVEPDMSEETWVPREASSYKDLSSDVQDYIQDADNYLEEYNKYFEPKFEDAVAAAEDAVLPLAVNGSANATNSTGNSSSMAPLADDSAVVTNSTGKSSWMAASVVSRRPTSALLSAARAAGAASLSKEEAPKQTPNQQVLERYMLNAPPAVVAKLWTVSKREVLEKFWESTRAEVRQGILAKLQAAAKMRQQAAPKAPAAKAGAAQGRPAMPLKLAAKLQDPSAKWLDDVVESTLAQK